MYFKVTYDSEFDDLMMHLRSKYPAKLFDIEGIGKQLDMCNFSRNFFAANTTADASVDANSNVDDVSVIAYNVELPKPFFKMNSYYVLWKELKRLYGHSKANEIIEMQLTGYIYIHDFHGVAAGQPYSYYGKTVIAIKDGHNIKYSTMEDLYSKYSHGDNEIDLSMKDMSILDKSGVWTKLTRLLRHKSHTNLVQLETKNGFTTIVTADHPVILEDGSEKCAEDLTLDDALMPSDTHIPLLETKVVNDDYAYLVGFMIGDGCMMYTKGEKVDIRRGSLYIFQNDIIDSKIYAIANSIYDNVRITRDNVIQFGYKRDVESLLDTGIGSINRKLPNDVLTWNKSALKSLLAGLIDSEGNVNNQNGLVTIRVTSFELVQQIGEIFRALNLGVCRTSVCGKFESVNGFKSNHEIYRVSIRLTDTEFIKYSEKIAANAELVFKTMKQRDGRFETNKLHKIIPWETPEYVYDVTTESGHFHCQGLIQHNCFNYSTYDIVTNGLPMIKKVKSIPPKYLHAFKSQIEQFIIIASNSTLGATGLADLLISLSYYAKNIVETKSDAHYKFQTEEDCWTYVAEMLTSFIYSVNFSLRANQCVTEDTEVLTPAGFKKYYELNVGNDIYTWKDGKLNIQPVQRVNVSDYNGIMHQYSGRDVVQTVTPNHRVLYKENNKHTYDLTESSNLFERLTPLTIPVAMLEDDRPDYPITDNLLKLLVLVLTDGNIKNDDGKRSRVSLFKSPTRWGNDEILRLFESLSIQYTHQCKENGFNNGGMLNHYNICADDSQMIIELLNGTKVSLPDWMFKLSRRQANLVIDLWAKLDGHTAENEYGRQKLQCDNYTIADQLQHMCFLAGRGSKITARKIGDNKQETIYVIPYSRQNKDARKKESVQYSGKVWCPTTEDGVVVFRKDGKIFISGNSPFTNVSVFDRFFLEKLCSDYIFPDGSHPDIKYVQKLQAIFLDIMNHEMERTPLTFPVVTACFSVDDDNNIQDEDFLDFIAEKNLKYGFINIYCGKTSTLSSCCRLRSETDTEYFNSFGSGSSKIGSLGVCAINLPRLALIANKSKVAYLTMLTDMVEVCAAVNNAKRHIVKKRITNGNAPLYTLGFMDLNKQYSTVGVNGLNEAVEIMGYKITDEEGQQFVLEVLDVINTQNARFEKQYGAPHNCEQVPGENMSIKIVEKDNLLGFKTDYEMYSNQFIPLTATADMLDRIKIQGAFDKHFSGGAICHINVDTPIQDKAKIKELMRATAKMGVIYHAINYNLQECSAGHMSVGRKETCSVCGEPIINNFTRVVGFLTNTKNWHKVRREIDYPYRQFYENIDDAVHAGE